MTNTKSGRAADRLASVDGDIVLDEAVEAVQAVMLYAYNVSNNDFALDVYQRSYFEDDGGYVQSKLKLMRADVAKLWGSLDASKRELFVKAALKKYGG